MASSAYLNAWEYSLSVASSLFIWSQGFDVPAIFFASMSFSPGFLSFQTESRTDHKVAAYLDVLETSM